MAKRPITIMSAVLFALASVVLPPPNAGEWWSLVVGISFGWLFYVLFQNQGGRAA